MLAANERLTGRTFVYDGNPHEFGDPAHAARVNSSPPATTAVVPAPARNEDHVAHVKERDGEDVGLSAENSSKGESHRSSRGKDGETGGPISNANNAGTGAVTTAIDASAAVPTTTTTTTVMNGRAPAAGSSCSQDVGGLCTEGANGGGGVADGVPTVSLWGDAPATGTTSAVGAGAGAGVFGDFKFDMMDIMSAVPQG